MSNSEQMNVILGVTGGIAAYKSPELVRRLRAGGALVQVIMTPSAEKLVSSTVFNAVSDRPVRVVDGRDIMEAVGFRVNMKDGTFQLLSRVKLTYAVN